MAWKTLAQKMLIPNGSSRSVIWYEAIEELREEMRIIKALWDGTTEIPRWIIVCAIKLSMLGPNQYPSWDCICWANVDHQQDHPWLHPTATTVTTDSATSLMTADSTPEEEGQTGVTQDDKRSEVAIPEGYSKEQRPEQDNEEPPIQGWVNKGKAKEVDPEAPPMPVTADAKGKGKAVEKIKQEEEEPSQGRSHTQALAASTSGSGSKRSSMAKNKAEVSESSAPGTSTAANTSRPPCSSCHEKGISCQPRVRSKACNRCFGWKIKCSWVTEGHSQLVNRPQGHTKSRCCSTSPSTKAKTPHQSKSQAKGPAPKTEIDEPKLKATQPKTPAGPCCRPQSPSDNPSTSGPSGEWPSATKHPHCESKTSPPATVKTMKSYLVESSTKGPKAHGNVKKTFVFDGVEIPKINTGPCIIPTRSPAPGPSSSSDINAPMTLARLATREVQRLAEECAQLHCDNMALEQRIQLLESGLKTFGDIIKGWIPDLTDSRLHYPFADSAQSAERANPDDSPIAPILPDTEEHQCSPSPSLPDLPQCQFQQLDDEDSPMEETAEIDNLVIGIGAAAIGDVADPVAPTANTGDDTTMSADQVIGSVNDGTIGETSTDALTQDQTAKITDGRIGTESIGDITEPGAPDANNGHDIQDLADQVTVSNTTNAITPDAIIGDQTADMDDHIMGGDTIGNGRDTIGNTAETFPGGDGVIPGTNKGGQTSNVGDQSMRTVGDNTDRLTTSNNTCEEVLQVNQVAEGEHACNANNEGDAGTSAQILAAVGEDRMELE
ncbi:hypothetical protein EV363DRAFT_1451843 [Boletus edulis]|nr:hypothetical protein EV363DRAFT_1451843 [Boletus edulis]